MVYGEVGKLPLQIFVEKQLVSYWLRILDKDKNTLAYITYIIVLNLFMRNEYNAHWLIKVNNKQLWFIIHVVKSTNSPHQTVQAHNT